MDDNNQLALGIRARRIGLGLPREELAARIGVAPFTLGSWERGDRSPSGTARVALASAFDCSVEDLEIAPEGASHEARLDHNRGRPLNDAGGLPFSGLALKTWRVRSGFTQSTLAEVTGLSASTICELERGRRLPTYVALATLAGGLGCELEDLAAPPVLVRPDGDEGADEENPDGGLRPSGE